MFKIFTRRPKIDGDAKVVAICNKCGWIWRFKVREASVRRNWRGKITQVINCPSCGTENPA